MENFFEVADEGYVGAYVLVDFAGVDFDVDLLGVRRVAGEVAGNAVVETHAEGEQEIGLLDGGVDPRLAVHAHHAELQRVRGGDRAEAEERRGDRDLLRLCEGEDFAFGARLDDAVAGEDDGLLRLLDECDGLLDARGLGLEHRVWAVGLRLCGFEGEDGGGLLRVLGDVDEDGPGAAAGCYLKCQAHCCRDVFGARDEEVVLGDRERNAGDIDFLEGVAAEDFGGDLSRDRDDRDAVEHGCGEAGDEVRRAGAACSHAHAGAA